MLMLYDHYNTYNNDLINDVFLYRCYLITVISVIILITVISVIIQLSGLITVIPVVFRGYSITVISSYQLFNNSNSSGNSEVIQ